MRSIKMLGLAVVAAMAVMAMVGVGSASAAISLCKVSGETPCTNNPYSYPLKIEGVNKGETVLKAGFSEVKCQNSKVVGEATGTETSGGIEQVIGKITSAEWTNCHCLGGLAKATATAIQTPWRAHDTEKEPVEQNNGNFYVGELEGKGQPGAKVSCEPSTGTTTCEYKVSEAQPGHTGEWGKMQFKGGNPAEIIASQISLKLVKSEPAGQCANPGLWSGTYEVITPKPVYQG